MWYRPDAAPVHLSILMGNTRGEAADDNALIEFKTTDILHRLNDIKSGSQSAARPYDKVIVGSAVDELLTMTAGASPTDTTLTVNVADPDVVVGDYLVLKQDREIMRVTGKGTNSVQVTRGVLGTDEKTLSIGDGFYHVANARAYEVVSGPSRVTRAMDPQSYWYRTSVNSMSEPVVS